MLAFGGAYRWAHPPLLIACGIFALVEWVRRATGRNGASPQSRGATRALLVAWVLVGLAVAIQLAPIPAAALPRISPGLHALLMQHDLGYAAAARGAASTGGRVHALSIDPSATWRGLAFVAGCAAMFFAARSLFARVGVRRLTEQLRWVTLLVALIGLIQRAMFNGRIYGFWRPIARNFDAFGPFVNHNHFAGWMLLTMSLQVGLLCGVSHARSNDRRTLRERILWLSSPEGGRYVMAAFTIAVAVLAIVFSLSRSGMASLVVMLMMVVGVWLFRRRRGAVRVGAIALITAIPLCAFAWAGSDYVVRRFSNVPVEAPFRIGIWKDTIRIIRDMPLTGTGFNTFGIATAYYQTAEPTVHFEEAHNDYLQLASEGGLLLLIPAAILIAVFGWQVAARFRQGTDDTVTWWIRVGAVAGLAAIAVQSLVEFSLQMPANAVLCAVVAAVASHVPATGPVNRKRGHR